jgi:hypothetical protein
VVHPVLEPDLREKVSRPLAGLASAHAREAHGSHDVLAGGEARDQVERLEDDAHGLTAIASKRRPPELGDVDVADPDLALCRGEDAGQARQERGLARAARAEQDDELTVAGLDIEPLDGSHHLAALGVLDGEVLDRQVRHLVRLLVDRKVLRQVLGQVLHHAPEKASAGSVRTARRTPKRLATTPTSTATTGSAR